MADDDVHRIKLKAKSIEDLRSYLDATDLDFGCRPPVRQEGGEYVVEVYAPMPEVERIRSARSATGDYGDHCHRNSENRPRAT